MIQVIDGKRYNTDTAERVFCDWNGLSQSDFRYASKDLYRTKTGVWFFHVKGGPRSIYSEGNSWSESLYPIDGDEAFRFLENNSSDSEAMSAIDQYFSDRVTDA